MYEIIADAVYIITVINVSKFIDFFDILPSQRIARSPFCSTSCFSPGKSTLAALLAARWDCTLVHADDFFLRPEQRTPERMAQPGGNFDRERFEAEVLAPLREGRDALYRPYDCHAGCLKEPVAAPCRPVVLAEGSYTCHPDLWPCYDLHVFVTAPLEVRLARLARRPGVDLEAFRTRWIPLEEAYFASQRLPERCDLVLET